MTRSMLFGARAAVLISLATVPVAGCTKADGAADGATGERGEKPVVTATTGLAGIEPFTHTVSAIGTVVARPGHYAALSAPAPTRIARVYVSSGQRVAAGTPLVEFEQVGFDAAATGAQATVAAAQSSYGRAQRLAREGILPRKDVEQAAAALAVARSAAVTTRRAQQLSVLRSPVTGVVTRMSAVMGAPADVGQTLVEVVDPSSFDVVLSLGSTESREVRAGARVTLSAGERVGGETLGAGTVASVAAAVDSGSRAVSVRVALTSPRRGLRLGESVYGEIAVATRANAVVVPVEALVPDAEGYTVFVVNAQGVASARPVKVGGRTETRVEIIAGLRGGETIVTKGAFGIEDGARVVPPRPATP